MSAWLKATVVLATAFSATGVLSDLDKSTVIDRVYVHPQTKQAALALVTNYALEQSRDKLEAKLKTYRRYVETGKLYEQYPEVAANLPVVLMFTVMVPPNAQARELLNTERRQLEKQGFEVWVNIYDPKTDKLRSD